MVAENHSLSECVTSQEGSISDHMISLTSGEDSIHANCCAAGNPLPFVSWELCRPTSANSTSCNALTNATHLTAALTLTGTELPGGNSSVRCVAEYLDVTDIVRSIWLHNEKQDYGKTQHCYR